MRYGLPPFVRLRPRPDAGYEDDGAKAMQGDWKPTAVVFRRLLDLFLEVWGLALKAPKASPTSLHHQQADR